HRPSRHPPWRRHTPWRRSGQVRIGLENSLDVARCSPWDGPLGARRVPPRSRPDPPMYRLHAGAWRPRGGNRRDQIAGSGDHTGCQSATAFDPRRPHRYTSPHLNVRTAQGTRIRRAVRRGEFGMTTWTIRLGLTALSLLAFAACSTK